MNRRDVERTQEPGPYLQVKSVGTTHCQLTVADQVDADGTLSLVSLLHTATPGYEIIVDAAVPLPYGIKIDAQGRLAPQRARTDESLVRTGHLLFDARVNVRASDVAGCLGLLDESARELLREIYTSEEVVSFAATGTSIRLRLSTSKGTPDPDHLPLEWLQPWVKVVVALGRHLRRPGTPEQWLSCNVFNDANAGVRRRSLEVLRMNSQHDPATVSLLLMLRRKAPVSVKRKAAMLLGEKGVLPLNDLLQDLPDEVARELVGPVANLANPSILPFMRKAVMRGWNTRVALIALKQLEDTDSVPHLIEALPRQTDPETRKQLVETLHELADESAATILTTLLEQSGSNRALRLALVDLLGKCGVKESVEVLLRVSGDSLLDFRLKRAIGNSIAQIQERLGPVKPGWISVSSPDPQEGGLTLVAGTPRNPKSRRAGGSDGSA